MKKSQSEEDEMVKKYEKQISNWFEFDLIRPESQYVAKLKRVRTISTSSRDLISNRSDCTISKEDLNVMFFYPHLDFIFEFHSLWNEKRLNSAHEDWKQKNDLSRCVDAFEELCGGRGRPLTRYTPLLQAKWDSDRVFRRFKEDDLILERLKRDKISVAELQNLLCAPHTQLMRYKMKFSTLVKFVERSPASSVWRTNLPRFRDVLKRLEASTKRVNENAIWAPVKYTQTLFSQDPFENGATTFRGRDGEVRLRNFKYKIQIGNQILDMYLLQGSVLISTQDQICLDCVSWARVKGMRVSRNKQNRFEIRASEYGGKFWSNDTLPCVVVLESDSLAGSLDEEIQKLQRDSKNWSATRTSFIQSSKSTSTSSSHIDLSARVQCILVVSFFVLVYAVGIIVREFVAEEHDATLARLSAPRNLLSYVANYTLTLFGYFLPYGAVMAIRIMSMNSSTSLREELISDTIRWFTLWIMSRFIVEPMSNILCPVLTVGTSCFGIFSSRHSPQHNKFKI